MKIRKILKRCTAAMLAAAIGMTTLAANVSAATKSGSVFRVVGIHIARSCEI